MPLYEFRCPRGHDFEKFYRSIGTSQSEERCPECGAIAVRLMSPAGLVFKGSGFYITDYGKDGKKAEREAATATAAKSETSKTESISADTTGAKSAESGTAAAPSKPAETRQTESRQSERKQAESKPPLPPAKPAASSKKAE